ncbi:ABC transporter ATP-binding protein [Burkholderia sp. L27(2015)]|uniref:ABC transporter ATP-binding protein n=1 Tax=Burkholderia sp. L27(2015) TaxID=1641858 RepID=UPI00131EA3CB|nr:oligopeptide/dipeptide ABC transporter ATP-binding protein [Burkholderia sp. L27(2015)]
MNDTLSYASDHIVLASSSSQSEPALLELKNISKRFIKRRDIAVKVAGLLGVKSRSEVVHALDSVSLQIRSGEVVGLVGESGCGKSTLGRIVVGLDSPSGGERTWRGRDYGRAAGISASARLEIQMIFQDPYASLNPRLRVLDLVGEAPVVHKLVSRDEQKDYVQQTLTRVGIDPGTYRRFPHQFSGGQRARIGIARALAVRPKFIVCDESVAALDVSIQAQVLNLFMRLRDELALTYLFISHDLGVVKHISDRVIVMYLGRVIESASTDELFANPNHPYTQALLAEAPSIALVQKSYAAIRGEIPSPLAPPPGCHFHPRCPHAVPLCGQNQPPLKEVSPGHFSACHLNE